LYAVVEHAVTANGGVQGHWGLVLICDGGASLGTDGNGLADVPRIAVTPSSLLVLHGEPGSVISLVPLLLHSPQDTATPLKQPDERSLMSSVEDSRDSIYVSSCLDLTRVVGSDSAAGSETTGKDLLWNSQRSRVR